MVIEKNILDLNQAEFKQFADLNYAAFGDAESIDDQIILEKCREGKLNCITFFDDEDLLASVVYMLSETVAYYLFVVVADKYRNQGYGSKILKYLAKKYSDRQQVIEIESLSEKNSPNYKERISRCNFYLRNGYHLTKCQVIIRGVLLDVMCTGELLDKAGYAQLLEAEKEFIEPIILL
ncbi:MAG: GNAT family N-acetyltransferase [Erysipelotrichia bacterium]|nr:GNAT family N-acetyltransferase [Erysipelotrichia bacterium]